jgi:hypothetical protein
MYTEIQMGSCAKLYMRKGYFIYEEMREYLVIYEEMCEYLVICEGAISHI